MKIIINDRKEETEYTGKNLGDVLDKIRGFKVPPGTYVETLHLNGQLVDFDAESTRLTSLTEVKTLEIKIVTILGILNKNIANVEDYLQKLIPGIEKAAELFQLGNEQEASKFFINIVDGIEWISQALNEILKALATNPSTLQFKGQTIQERQKTLIDLTSQLLEAHKIKDWVLVADLLHYEIAPYYNKLLEIIPDLKKMAKENIN